MLKKMGKGYFVSFLVLLIWGFGVVCSATEPPALARLSGAEKERVASLIEGAKKEGELHGYSSSLRPDVQAKVLPAFRKEYGLSDSDLKIKIISTRTGGVVTKVTEELRAKVYKADVVQMAGGVAFFNDLISRGEIMAYDSPDFKIFHPMAADPKVGAANPPYYLAEHFSTYGIVYNPKYVKGEIAHWKDVLRPQYKGKISCGDVSKSFSYTEAYLAIRKVVGVDFWKELAKQEPFLLVSASDLANKAISGEYPIIVIAAHSTSFRPNLKGAGLKLIFPPEGFAVIGSPTVILAHAPHPNAAKLWLDFNRSEMGQSVWLNDAGYPVGRPGTESKYSDYPLAISAMKGYIEMDWRKISAKERSNAREEFRRIMVEKRK